MTTASSIPAVAIVGFSGAGKTTLIERIIPVLAEKGWRIGVIKHDVHHFDIDHPGKDTYRHREAGAAAVAISSADRLAFMVERGQNLPLPDLIELMGGFGINAVFVEGYKQCHLPKLAVLRRAKDLQLLNEIDGVNICAVGGELSPNEVQSKWAIRCVSLDDLQAITGWIQYEFDRDASTHSGTGCG